MARQAERAREAERVAQKVEPVARQAERAQEAEPVAQGVEQVARQAEPVARRAEPVARQAERVASTEDRAAALAGPEAGRRALVGPRGEPVPRAEAERALADQWAPHAPVRKDKTALIAVTI